MVPVRAQGVRYQRGRSPNPLSNVLHIDGLRDASTYSSVVLWDDEWAKCEVQTCAGDPQLYFKNSLRWHILWHLVQDTIISESSDGVW